MTLRNLFIITATLISTSLSAQSFSQTAVVHCELSPKESRYVKSIKLVSRRTLKNAQFENSGGMIIEYRNGKSQRVRPTAKADTFGQANFAAQMPFKKGRTFFPGTAVGDIHVDFACYLAPRTPWDRCQSQGTGEHGKYSRVQLKISNKPVIQFKGKRLCRRIVR